jgi:hypothetical protein
MKNAERRIENVKVENAKEDIPGFFRLFIQNSAFLIEINYICTEKKTLKE